VSDFPIVIEAVRDPMTLFRGCRGSHMQDLVAAMRSNYEVGRSPHPAERRAIAVYMAVSMFENDQLLRRLALRRPDRIGTHLACIELRPRLGICIANTGSEGHWSIWGLPTQLAECVIDVVPTDRALS
jgi:hypothetical protein